MNTSRIHRSRVRRRGNIHETMMPAARMDPQRTFHAGTKEAGAGERARLRNLIRKRETFSRPGRRICTLPRPAYG